MPLFKFDFIPKVEVSLHVYILVIFTFCITPILALFVLELSHYRDKTVNPRGCRKLGLRIQSNLADEFEKKYEEGVGPDQWGVKSLWIYPVKSCRGVELQRGGVIATGMQYDRHFSFAQLKDSGKGGTHWSFVTQRRYPRMARIRTEIWVPDSSSPTYSPKAADVQSGGVVIVTFPDETRPQGLVSRQLKLLTGSVREKSFRVPFMPTSAQIERNGYTMEEMTIWKDSPKALNMSRHVPPELQAFLGIDSKLGIFRVAPGNEREVFRCAPRKEEIGWQPVTGFCDAYPLHILILASVRDVSNKQPEGAPRLSALRFRPNIIVSGPPAYAEDTWKKIRIGETEYFVACRTSRCRLPNIDPETGEKHPTEPDKTLMSFRCVDDGAGKNASLGMQMVPASNGSGIVKVGDTIHVLEIGDHHYIQQ
ncbi:MAG: hypothetical protein M1832_004524 [Thelocarpon impressellum]|nr:MAG: hypothetical protein M1832_004524 [Thelocarpon impressellum]